MVYVYEHSTLSSLHCVSIFFGTRKRDGYLCIAGLAGYIYQEERTSQEISDLFLAVGNMDLKYFQLC